MKLTLISGKDTHIIIDATGWSAAVKDAALRRIIAGEVPSTFDAIELNVQKMLLTLTDNSTVFADRYEFHLRAEGAQVLYNHYKSMFLPEIQAAEVAAFTQRIVKN